MATTDFGGNAAFPYIIPPVSNVAGFTYRAGATYLEVLYALRDYILNTIQPGMDAALADVLTKFQDGIANAEAVTTAQGAEWDTRYNDFIAHFTDQVSLLNTDAVAGMVSDTGSTVHANLLTLIDAEISSTTAAANAYTDGKVAGVRGDLDTLTGTVTGLRADTTTLQGTVAANTQATQDNGYLVAGFLSNAPGGVGWGGEKLAVFYSPDGKTVFGGARNPVYTPADGAGLRDPSVAYLNDTFYAAYTRNNGIDKNFAIASSPTGAPGTWSLLATVGAASVPGMSRLWAPEIITGDDGTYILFASVDASGNGSSYWIKDIGGTLSTWTAPAPLTWAAPGPPASIIDATAVKRRSDGAWVLFYKNEGAASKYIERAVSTGGLTGPYTVDRTANWAGWGSGVEGPEVVWDRDRYRIYFDAYNAGTGVQFSESTDLDTWTPQTAVAHAGASLLPSEQLRHGSVVPLTVRGRNKLLAGMLTTRPRHLELTFSVTANKATVTRINGYGVDSLDTLDGSFLSVGADGMLTFNEMGIYAIDISMGIPPGGPSITRAFGDLLQSDGVHWWKRVSGGVEGEVDISHGNFKPSQYGDKIGFEVFFDWSTAQISTPVNGRLWITQTSGIG